MPMRARYVTPPEFEKLLAPGADAWEGVRPERLRLGGTPLALQPTAAIQVAWAKRRIGAVDRVEVAACHDGARLAVHLDWPDATENRDVVDTGTFPDAAAVVFAAKAGVPLITMGAPGLSVNAWYWRADEASGREVVAEGIGSSRTLDVQLVTARGVWKGGRWHVTIARALRPATGEPVVLLEPGKATPFAVAVWEGGNGERAGIKAFSGEWRDLALDPAPAAKRS
jgi:DMSO reductase family type II enzyme heme b subunit